MTIISENENMISAMESILQIINSINSQEKIQDKQVSRLSEFTAMYNTLRRLYKTDYIVEANRMTTSNNFEIHHNDDDSTFYLGIDTGLTLNDLNLFTGDILKASNGENGMIVAFEYYIASETYHKEPSLGLKLIMKDKNIIINPNQVKELSAFGGLAKFKLEKPYYLLKDLEDVIFDENDTKNSLYITINERNHDEALEWERRSDEETTNEMIRQLFPEYFD
ncbi:hypothetical protein [Exiguobacterium sp. s26]|uniref:hypothetical protein n=1 Tax=Exiguobacterium sp. s26 TaxID=2751231 RepID=UPI001BEAE1F5|nr:hypothetical protein [Exiguobacterium sp. s26]